MESAIKVENLIKSYGKNTVLKGISFEVQKGESFALLGANGAGKTTALECIEGLRKYKKGNISINGKFGVQLQSASLPENIKALEAFTLFSRWNKVNPDMSLFKSLGLFKIKNKMYCSMSGGQKRRLHLALALIGSPDIVFLDEPTAGLDVEGRNELHNQIKKLKGQGRTLILCSHDMAEVESLCDKIAILKDGNIVFIGTADEITCHVNSKVKIQIKTCQPFINDYFINSKFVEYKNDYYTFVTSNISEALIEILTFLKKSANVVLDLKIVHETLEESFLDIVKEGEQ